MLVVFIRERDCAPCLLYLAREGRDSRPSFVPAICSYRLACLRSCLPTICSYRLAFSFAPAIFNLPAIFR